MVSFWWFCIVTFWILFVTSQMILIILWEQDESLQQEDHHHHPYLASTSKKPFERRRRRRRNGSRSRKEEKEEEEAEDTQPETNNEKTKPLLLPPPPQSLTSTTKNTIKNSTLRIEVPHHHQQQRKRQRQITINKSSASPAAKNTTSTSTSTTTTATTSIFVNSLQWLKGPRYHNINNQDDPLINDDYIETTILNIPKLFESSNSNPKSNSSSTSSSSLFFPYINRLLGQQTLAIKKESSSSPILYDFKLPTSFEKPINNYNYRAIRLWNVRLHYLAIHVHQHWPAFEEAKWRQENPIKFQQLQQQYPNLGNFDFECPPDTKYLLVNLLNFGIGANVYWSMIHAFKAGIVTDRIVHFVHEYLPTNTAIGKKKNRNYNRGWKLASCKPRQDSQCTFVPSSPCVPTLQDIENGYQLDNDELSLLYKKGKLQTTQAEKQNQKVIFAVATAAEMGQFAWEHMDHIPEKDAKQIIQNLLFDNNNNHSQQEENDSSSSNKAATATTTTTAPVMMNMMNHGYQFGRLTGTLNTMLSSYFAYSMRLRPTKLKRVEQMIQESFAAAAAAAANKNDDAAEKQLEDDVVVGLPIRASDKCEEESECLTFQQHMQVVQSEWSKLKLNLNNNNNNNFNLNLINKHNDDDDDDRVPPSLTMSTTTTTTMPNSKNMTIIFTTESKDMIHQQEQYYQQRLLKVQEHQQHKQLHQPPPPRLRFITNPHDMLDPVNTGNHEGPNPNADRDLLLAISAIQLQLYSRLTIGNCCSNFARVMQYLLEGGFGSYSGSDGVTFRCMEDADDPRLRICCWKNKACLRRKAKDTEAFLAAMGSTNNNNKKAAKANDGWLLTH